MQVFLRVAEAGSLAAAGRQLGMSPPAVTRAIAALERRVGTTLLIRTTRWVKLTEPGRQFLVDCKRLLAELDEAEAAAAGSFGAPTGTLTVSASVLFGQIYVLPVLTEFLDRHPAVTGRAVLLDRITGLVEEGIDVAIRIAALPDSSYIAIRVGAVRRVVCAAPAYIQRHGTPLTPQDLTRHRLIAAGNNQDWRFSTGPAVPIAPALECTTNQAAISAAESGFGLTRVLSYQIGPQLQAGTLQTVLADHEPDPVPIHIVHPEGRRPSAKLRAFVDLAVERLRANPLFS